MFTTFQINNTRRSCLKVTSFKTLERYNAFWGFGQQPWASVLVSFVENSTVSCFCTLSPLHQNTSYYTFKHVVDVFREALPCFYSNQGVTTGCSFFNHGDNNAMHEVHCLYCRTLYHPAWFETIMFYPRFFHIPWKGRDCFWWRWRGNHWCVKKCTLAWDAVESTTCFSLQVAFFAWNNLCKSIVMAWALLQTHSSVTIPPKTTKVKQLLQWLHTIKDIKNIL